MNYFKIHGVELTPVNAIEPAEKEVIEFVELYQNNAVELIAKLNGGDITHGVKILILLKILFVQF